MKSQPGSSQLQSFLEELYERYKLPLLRMIHKHVGDSGVGEDLFHEVFIRIIHKAKLLYSLPKLKQEAYIYLIAKGVSFDYLRKKYKDLETAVSEEAMQSLVVERNLLRPSGNDNFAKVDLAIMLESLPAEDQILLIGKYNLNLSIKDLASIVGGTETSVRSKLHRARKKAFEQWMESGISMEDFINE